MAYDNDYRDRVLQAYNLGMVRAFYDQECGESAGKIDTSGWKNYNCPFPGHKDGNPSFSVCLFDRGGFFCQGCGLKGGDVIEYHRQRYGSNFPDALKALGDFAGVSPDKKKPLGPILKNGRQLKKKKKFGKITKVYQYTDKDGKLAHEVCRTDGKGGKDFFQRRPDPNNPKERINNIQGITLYPFNLPNVIKSEMVFVVEGEKDAENLAKIGLVATCNAQGAGKWPDNFVPYFKNKDVVILPDYDKPGEKHARLVSNKLYAVAKSVKTIILLETHKGADVSDWIEAGGTKEKLLEIVKEERAYRDHIDFLNEKHAMIMLGGKSLILNNDHDPVFDREIATFSSASDFYYRYANRKIDNPRADEKGQGKKINITTDWINSQRRREYNGIVFSPGKNVNGAYNLWRGFAFEPQPGGWPLFKQHIKEVIANDSDYYYKWLLTWMARIIQYPGRKRPGTAIVLRGEQGTGKGAFLSNFGKLFGPHYLQVNNQKHLTGRFNGHMQDVLFLFVDEGFWAGDKSSEGILKGLVTEDTLSIESKGRDAFVIKNHINLAMASNNEWVVPSGMFERRFFVLDVSNKHQQDHKYFGKIRAELENGGYEAMLYDLLRFDLTTTDIRVIPRTGALFDQVVETMSPFDKFWFDKLRNGVLDPKNEIIGDEWLKDGNVRIQTSILYDEYIEFCDRLGIRRKKVDYQFGKDLKKVCPKVEKKYKAILDSTGAGQRKWHYEFPRLQICRDFFEKKIGRIEYVWDEDKVFVDGKFE